MTGPGDIPANERGQVRIFALADQLSMEIAHSGVIDRLSRAIGVKPLNDADVQLVQVRAIADMGLPAFLQDAYDIDPADFAPHADTLNALTGTIAILRSGAFGGRKVQIAGNGEATLIATFSEPGPDWSARPMPTKPLARQSPRVARSRARRIGFSLFAVMMTMILLFVFWLAT